MKQVIANSDSPPLPPWQRSAAEERMNVVTHGAGLVLAIVGALVMAIAVASRGDLWIEIGCAVYLASLVCVYLMSTLSHGDWSLERKSFFRRLDQAFIYLLIAGTYTPFSLAYLRTGWWWALLGAMWFVAIVGFVSKLFFAHRVDAISIVSYVLLGWMPIMSAPALSTTLPLGAFVWMLIGGACYTLGTIFLVNDERVRHFHAIWHIFVIAGSACHFIGILLFVVGVA
jgi:hemolysin III